MQRSTSASDIPPRGGRTDGGQREGEEGEEERDAKGWSVVTQRAKVLRDGNTPSRSASWRQIAAAEKAAAVATDGGNGFSGSDGDGEDVSDLYYMAKNGARAKTMGSSGGGGGGSGGGGGGRAKHTHNVKAVLAMNEQRAKRKDQREAQRAAKAAE